MPNGYSTELRTLALSALDGGMPRAQVCASFQISAKTLFNWIKLRKETGSADLRSRPKARVTRKLTKDKLMDYLNKHPDHYLKEIAAAFDVKSSSVFNALKKFGISRKKNDAVLRARRAKEARLSSRNRGDRS